MNRNVALLGAFVPSCSHVLSVIPFYHHSFCFTFLLIFMKFNFRLNQIFVTIYYATCQRFSYFLSLFSLALSFTLSLSLSLWDMWSCFACNSFHPNPLVCFFLLLLKSGRKGSIWSSQYVRAPAVSVIQYCRLLIIWNYQNLVGRSVIQAFFLGIEVTNLWYLLEQ